MEIIINDTKCGFIFNLHAIEYLDKVKQQGSVFAFLASIVWGGYQGWRFAKQFEADFEKNFSEVSFEQMTYWLDKANYEEKEKAELEGVMNAWKESEAYKKWVKTSSKEAKKKK
jgi:mevalonate pyrophosphate decarboxylase